MAEGYNGKAQRTEHAGAKNGGGFWGYRSEAKRSSKIKRRHRDHELENGREESYGRHLEAQYGSESDPDERGYQD